LAAVALLLACGPVGCSSHDDEVARADAAKDGAEPGFADAAPPWTDDDAASMTPEASARADDASNDAFSFDASVVPPPMSCDADASDDAYASYCPPPLSTCADSQHLVYFDWGTCVSGQCVWPQKVLLCSPYSSACSNGACISTITAPL
jgi:hypothetical protein